ncbi:MAG: glycerol-3-phosphate dehydrogenase [Candidatus Latescibacterota bacterium]|nr:MAG: glycerol-3-phosphate dehydrogenase [Candidatus Latescibacterota bacterium]
MRKRLAQIDPHADLVIIGGGINGAGVARDAAERGFRVILVEKDDFASGTSSRTSKLVHGGVRYLEQGAIRLVWEACHERQTLLRIAPHLVRPLPFVFPLYEDSRFPPWQLRLGMWLYDVLAAFRNVRRHRMLRPRRSAWLHGLRRGALRAAALYYDAAMDDTRLVLENILAARAAGATPLNDVVAQRLLIRDGQVRGVEVEERQSGARVELTAPLVLACAGPWTNALLSQLPGSPRPVAPTRGTHIVVRRLREHALTLAAGRDGRVFFVLPWVGLTLVGTTDARDDSDPDEIAPTESEIEYLVAEANRFLPDAHLTRDDVIAAFVGLRPLKDSHGDASERGREHEILEPLPGLLCVVGGKYTTYRTVAEEIVDRVEKRLGKRKPCRTDRTALPGGQLAWSAREHWEEGARFQEAVAHEASESGVRPDAVRHLYRVYGARAPRVLALVHENDALGRALCAHQPHIGAEVVIAVREEMALHLDDWYLRRSCVGFHACHGFDSLERVADLFAAELGWNAATRAQEIGRARRELERIALTRSPASRRSA